MRRDWIRIEDLSRFMIQGGIKQYHPDDPRHTPYWRDIKKMCIEGLWAEDFNGFRYMPGRLFFYGHFCTIIDTDKEQKIRERIIPSIGDIEWERSYLYLEAEGFSGWKGDDLYTSHRDIFNIKKNWINSDMESNPAFFQSNGKFKEFIEPRENIRMIHKKPNDVPYYLNPASNIMELGSRGGGKSYYWSLAGAKYRMCFDALKYYNDKTRLNPPEIDIVVGSGRSDKSSEFCAKIETSMNELAKRNDLGAWGNMEDRDYQPSPLYKDMKGSIGPNNKENPWIHKYEMKVNGRWLSGFGTGSKLFHVNYSTQKKDGAEVAAGGRYTDLYYEEIGLTPLVIDAYNSNVATVSTGDQFGVQIFLGTSGNMETVLPAKKMFTHPKDYRILSYPDQYEGSEPIGLFLPAYMTIRKFKDKNGNTDIDAALKYFQAQRDVAAESNDPSVLRVEKMNYPILPSEMWQTGKGHILPSAEAEEREKILMKNNMFEKIGIPVKLRWDSSKRDGIDYNIWPDAEPFYEFPLESNSKRQDISGAIVIYDMPIEERGEVVNDMYVVTHDPYVSDDWAEGGSLGTAHVWLNPKYWSKYLVNSPLVATYIGKAKGGKKEYYENLEKLLAFYGNPLRGLWYEANRGEYCRGFFHKKNKAKLLCLRPQYEKGDNIFSKGITQYGFMVGNQVAKLAMLDDLADFLLKPIESMENRLVIETLPCIFTLRQIKLYEPKDGNFDAVSSIMGFPLYIREEEHRMLNEMKAKRLKKNPLAFLSANSKIMPKIEKHYNREWQQQ